jgi:hypothetical protein
VADANASAGADDIVFDIPFGGPQTIILSGSGLELGSSINILGGTQPGFSSAPLITIAADAANPPERLIDSGITLGGHTLSGLRFVGQPGMKDLVRLFTIGNSVMNCEFDGKGFTGNGIFVGGIALNTSIVQSRIYNSGVGIAQNIIGAATVIDDCDIRYNGKGIEFNLPIGLQVLTQTAIITNCVITENTGAGVRNHGGIVSRVLVRNNSIYNNGGLGIDNADDGYTPNNDDLLDDLLGDLGIISLGTGSSNVARGLLGGGLLGGILDGLLGDLLDELAGDLGLLPEDLLDNLLGNLGLLPDDVDGLGGLLDLLNLLPEDLSNLENILSHDGVFTGDLLNLDDLLLRFGVNINNLLSDLLSTLGVLEPLLGGSVNHPVITSGKLAVCVLQVQ